MSADREMQTFNVEWNGIHININWEPQWLNLKVNHYDVAHLDIESMKPERAPLPITETGYLSHFTSSATVASFGGPVEFVLAWLEEAACSPAWQAQAKADRQLALF